MDDVADLVVTPFRDIVEKGRTAVVNAHDAQPMLKAAQNLVKEGERALKHIEPLCKKQFDDFGPNFVKALKDNDEISAFRVHLTELLWEFDDFVEVDDFDADKFAELQAASRKAAPKICDILRRMDIEAPPRNFMSQLSPPSSPLPSVAAPHLGLVSRGRDSVASSAADTRSVAEYSAGDDSNPHQGRAGLDRHPSRDDTGHLAPPSEPEQTLEPEPIEPEPIEQPPPPPETNPWDPQAPPLAEDARLGDNFAFERRQPVDLPSEISPISPDHERRFSALSRRPVANGIMEHDLYEERRRSSSNSLYSNSSVPAVASRGRAPTMGSTFSPPIPEETSMTEETNTEMQQQATPFSPSSYPQYSPDTQHPSSPSAADPYQSAPHGGRSFSVVSQYGPLDNQTQGLTISDNNALSQQQSRRSSSATSFSQPGLELAPMNMTSDMEGLIPVESENVPVKPVHMPSRDCSIVGTSSFYLSKGFCDGAKDVVRGGIGVKKTKKPGFTTTTTIARCLCCLYELDFRQMEADVNKKDIGTLSKGGVNYRIRFLQKSHINAKRVDDVTYGCVFCVHQGRTTDESDATVFFSAKALCDHLARHPRPLPEIPGITVVDQVEVPEEMRNDFDLHFPNPPVPHPVQERASEIANLPRATAREHARRMYGQRLLYDRATALELAQGARLSGLRWPSKYHGEWCYAWHDGIYATVPTDVLKLDLPPKREIKLGGTSHVRATSKWKFAPKDNAKGEWLKFDKNEVITNISWPYPEHWCWSGTNARGKWGLFPQVFMDTNTLQELAAGGSDRASILNNERNRQSSISILSKLSMRRSSGRPPSIAESTSSRETTSPPALPNVYLVGRGSRASGDLSGG